MGVLRFRKGLYFLKNLKIKRLSKRIKSNSGRNHHGVITVRHRGFFNRRIYRVIDYRRVLWDIPGVLVWMEVDPNRNCYIGLFEFGKKIISYLLLPAEMCLNDVILNGTVSLGSAMLLKDVPLGAYVHNVESYPLGGGKFLRAAGAKGQIFRKSKFGIVTIRVKKKRFFFVSDRCLSVFGVVSNIDFKLSKLRKAGDSRWLGFRPHVRGVAMNPVDHPHGGGEGKTSGGRLPVTPWGKLTKGKKTLSLKRRRQIEILKKRSF
jgi:large subunit ribosomal protein L2